MEETKYNFTEIERKWQKKWEESKIFQVKEGKKKKFYSLEMYSYPSGSGLHMGHAFNYVIGDIFARFKRMQGFNVLHPVGYDSFGLPAENAAIKEGIHPRKFTDAAIKNFIEQQKALGLSYDWSRLLWSHDPNYYKWNQWLFIQLYKKGLAYRKKSPVNWCPKCLTVLANEQVHNGKCWRHENTDVEIKNLEQWFLKITDYAEELLREIDNLDWPERIKTMQRNWIGRSEGTEINFEIEGKKWPVFTTRPDTIFGVTFMVVSSQHPDIMGLVTEKQKKDVEKFLKKIKSTKQEDIDKMEKDGVFTGSYALNPMTKEKIPVWVGNFVLADYGSGMVMAVPAHDQRDFEFAKKHNLPLKIVIEPLNKQDFNVIVNDNDHSDVAQEVRKLSHYKEQTSPEEKSYSIQQNLKGNLLKHIKNNGILKQGNSFIIKYPHTKELIDLTGAFIGEGNLINSGKFNGINNRTAIKEITKDLNKNKFGKASVIYKFRDWLISRQRYWGTPIPVIYDEAGNMQIMEEKDLPVILPDDIKFGTGNPLETSKSFFNLRKNGKLYRRETDTMDTFFDSSWYYLRFTDSNNKKRPFDLNKASYWLPVDFYTGGAEHAVLHLLYARFFTKVLRDLGLVQKNLNEPFKRLFNQGMVHGEDGFVMSKSRGNVIDPMETIKKYGTDTLRIFLVSMSSPDKDFSWNSTGIETVHRFLKRIKEYSSDMKIGKSDARIQSKINSSIKSITEEIENLKYNMAIIRTRLLFDYINGKEIGRKDLESFLKILSIFAPHLAEELWHDNGNKSFISLEEWPKTDEKKINPEFEKEEKIIESAINDANNVIKIVKSKGKNVSSISFYVLPNELNIYSKNLDEIKRRTGLDVKVYSVSDKNKYDPENKSRKVKPGKPGIYLE